MRIEEGRAFHSEHADLAESVNVLSESGFAALTGLSLSVDPGEYRIISTTDEADIYLYSTQITFMTNMVTRDTVPVQFAGYTHFDLLAGAPGYYILDDADYEAIARGITPEWQGTMCLFNVDGRDSYSFAQDFFPMVVSSVGPERALIHI